MKKLISKHFKFINNLLGIRYRTLLVALIAMIILPSLLEGNSYQDLSSFILNSVVILLSIYAVHETQKQLFFGINCALILLVTNQLGIFRSQAALSFIIYILFYMFVAYRLLKMILVTASVNAGVLYAAILVYLFIGIIGGYLFMLIENAVPGSLNNLELVNMTNPSEFFYFSFITLSTLGYGDITPNLPPARALSMILSTTGPLYLTILVALLVSRFERD